MRRNHPGRSRNNKRSNNRVLKNVALVSELSPEQLERREKLFTVFVIAVLFGYGIYHSILYFGHQVVPNPDFTGFVRTGKQILSFNLPSSFKRAPLVGMLQVIISWFMPGQHPELTAGWIINAVLHPFNIVLVFLIARQLVGKAAIWVALISMTSPWLIHILRMPIAEIILLFFVLITIYLIFRRSNWAYLFASLTTMVRYEGAALIFALFVIDMIKAHDKKQRIMTFVYAFIASIPLALWMLGTAISFKNAGSTHYLKELGADGETWSSLVKAIKMTWQVGLSPLFISASSESMKFIAVITKFAAVVGFTAGIVFAILKREWKVLVLMIFFLLYLAVHVMHSFIIPRFFTTINWITLLMIVYGFQEIYKFCNKNNRIPRFIPIAAQILVAVFALVWLLDLLKFLPSLETISKRSVSLPWIAMSVSVMILTGFVIFFRGRKITAGIAVTTVVCLMFVSNHFFLVRFVGNGDRDIEFKYLTDWYLENAQIGEKIVSTMSNIMGIFAPEHKHCFLHANGLKSESPQEFVRKCYEKKVTYIAWDSRIGFDIEGRYYKLYRLENINFLVQPENNGPYEFIEQIKVNDRRLINIFRLKEPPTQTTKRMN